MLRAVRVLGKSMTDVAQRLRIAIPAAGVAVKKDDKSLTIRICCYRKL